MKRLASILAVLMLALCAGSATATTNRLGSVKASEYVVTAEDDPTVPSWAKAENPPASGLTTNDVLAITSGKRDLTNNVCAADSFAYSAWSTDNLPSGETWEAQPTYDASIDLWEWAYNGGTAQSEEGGADATSLTFGYGEGFTSTRTAIPVALSNDTFTTYGFVTNAIASATPDLSSRTTFAQATNIAKYAAASASVTNAGAVVCATTAAAADAATKYLPLSGGMMTGRIDFENNSSTYHVRGQYNTGFRFGTRYGYGASSIPSYAFVCKHMELGGAETTSRLTPDGTPVATAAIVTQIVNNTVLPASKTGSEYVVDPLTKFVGGIYASGGLSMIGNLYVGSNNYDMPSFLGFRTYGSSDDFIGAMGITAYPYGEFRFGEVDIMGGSGELYSALHYDGTRVLTAGLATNLFPIVTNEAAYATKAFVAGDAVTNQGAVAAAAAYTDALVVHTNPTFSNEVLAVGLNIDTNSVAVLNEIASTFGDFPIQGTATTVGGLLLALAAAVAWLKKNKANISDFTIGSFANYVSSLFSSDNTSLQQEILYQTDTPTASTSTSGTVETTSVTASPKELATVTVAAPASGNTTALSVTIDGADSNGVRNVILDVTNNDTAADCPIGIANTGAVARIFDGAAAKVEKGSRAIVTMTKLGTANEWLVTVGKLAAAS